MMWWIKQCHTVCDAAASFTSLKCLSKQPCFVLEPKITNSTFPGSLPSASYLSWIPDLHFREFSNFPSSLREVRAHHARLAGRAGTSPEGALTWIIQQLVWKMIVFGSVIDLPPEERRIYGLGAAAAEGVQLRARLFSLKMNNRTEFIGRP